MPYLTHETIEEAKRVDLLTYLKKENPLDLVSLGNSGYCLRSHDSLKISNGLWQWFSRGIGGRSALDYLIKVEGYPFRDAVIKLSGFFSSSGPVFESQDQEQSKKSGRTLILPERYKNNDRVYTYLTEGRGIDPEIISAFIHAGDIYENRAVNGKNGREYINAVFIGRDEEGAARQASIRGIYSGFKAEAPGSDKSFSFSAGAKNGSGPVHIYESAVDLLSYLTLLKKYGGEPYKDHHISLSGVSMQSADAGKRRLPLSLGRFLMGHPEIKDAVLHLDNDTAGREASAALISALSDKGISAVDAPPGSGKDVNDHLLERVGGRERCR